MILLYKIRENATTSGIVTIETIVVAVTALTESSTSLLYFAANIVVVAAVGAELAIMNATIIVLSIPHSDIITAAATGIATSLTTIAAYVPKSVNAFLEFACDR